MHLRARSTQTVHVNRANLCVKIAAGKTLWTVSCHKFTTAGVLRMGREAGFCCDPRWSDAEWPFADTLLVAD